MTFDRRVVQCEFLTFERGKSLEKTIQNVFERAQKGQRASLVIRLYDPHGLITQAVERSSIVGNASRSLMKAVSSYPNLRERPSGTMKDLISSMTEVEQLRSRLHKEAISLFVTHLEETISQEKEVAIDNLDFSFRLARPDERTTLVARARKATVGQIFSILTTDLCAGRHSTVTAASFP